MLFYEENNSQERYLHGFVATYTGNSLAAALLSWVHM